MSPSDRLFRCIPLFNVHGATLLISSPSILLVFEMDGRWPYS